MYFYTIGQRQFEQNLQRLCSAIRHGKNVLGEEAGEEKDERKKKERKKKSWSAKNKQGKLKVFILVSASGRYKNRGNSKVKAA